MPACTTPGACWVPNTAPNVEGGGGPAWSGFIITNPWQTYYAHSTHALRTLYSCTTHTLLMHYAHSTHALLTLYSCTAHTLLMHYAHSTHALLTLYSCTTHTLLMHYSHSTHALLMHYSHSTHALRTTHALLYIHPQGTTPMAIRIF
jgi:hypothetical protein